MKKQNMKNKKKENMKKIDAENLLEVFEDRLRDKYGVNIKEILDIFGGKKLVEEKKDIKIPLSIFRANKIGAAELLCKYLKDKEECKFSEIARLINRDPRTVALNYNNSKKKKVNLVCDKDSLYVPVDIFSDRRLSVLEAVVYYLKERRYKNFEIAKILNKDPRNIWTLSSRAEKKLKRS